jgi:hypothetical protein
MSCQPRCGAARGALHVYRMRSPGPDTGACACAQMYFSTRIHYFPCSGATGGRGNGTVVHTKSVDAVWRERVGHAPRLIEVYAPHPAPMRRA